MIIIQLLKDTKYPANYQIIIDSSLGNYAVLRDFFSALHEDMVVHGLCGRVPDSAGNACSLNCCCSGIANLSAHLHRLSTPPTYLRRIRLSPGRGVGVGCWIWLLLGQGLEFEQITARTNPCSKHLWGTLARAVASI